MASTALVLATTPGALAETYWTGAFDNRFEVFENWDSNFAGGDLVIDGAYSVTTATTTIATNINSVNEPTSGPRSLTISGGATLTSTVTDYTAIAVGWSKGVTSTLTVTGAGSKLVVAGTSGSTTDIGYEAESIGVLTVSDDATFETSYHVSVGAGSGSTGTLDVDDATLTLLGSAELQIGNGGTGTVNITNGSTATIAYRASVGYGEGATGSLNISSGSNVTVGDQITVGVANSSTGTITVSGGSTLTAESEMVLGAVGGSSGTFTVTGSGSTASITKQLYVGYGNLGKTTVSDGGSLTVGGDLALGSFSGSQGDLTVTGAGSTLKADSTVHIGVGGNGTVNIADGATATIAGRVYIGNSSGITGTLNITSGANVTAKDQIETGVSASSTGNITVSGGASFTVDNDVLLAEAAGTSSTFTVTGSGTTSTVTHGLYVGFGNLGKTVVSDGASLTVSGQLVLGYSSGSAGDVTVTGAGSTLKADGAVTVGNAGSSSLTVSNGGVFSAGTVDVAIASEATGTINIGAAKGQTATSAGTLDVDTLAFRSGTGKLVFNHTDSAYTFRSAVTGAGTIEVLSGVTSLTGDYSGYTGTVTVDGGLLSVDTSSFTQNAFTVNDDGALRVTGAMSTASDTVTLNGGSLINTGSIDGSRFGVELSSGYASAITTSGSIDGDVAAIHYSAGGNSLTILSGASFGNVVDYSLTKGNTTSFGAGSFSIPVAYYLEADNTVNLSSTRQTVLYSDTSGGSGNIKVVDTGTTASQFNSVQTVTSSIATMATDVLSVEFDRGAISSRVAMAYDDAEQKSESQKAISTMVGDGMAVDPNGTLFWMRAFGGASFDDYSDTSASHFGVAFGADHVFEKTRVGVMGGVGSLKNRSDDDAATASGDTVFGGLYLRQPLSDFTLDASVIAGGIFADTTRSVNSGTETARGDYDGWFVSPELALSRAYALSDGWTLTPRGSVRYTYGSFEGYAETGSTTMNLSYDDRETQAVEGAFELKLSKAHRLASGRMATLSVSAAALDTYNLGDSDLNASLSGTDLTVSTMGDRNQFGGRLGVGAELRLDASATLFGGVSATGYTDDSWSVAGNAGLKVQF